MKTLVSIDPWHRVDSSASRTGFSGRSADVPATFCRRYDSGIRPPFVHQLNERKRFRSVGYRNPRAGAGRHPGTGEDMAVTIGEDWQEDGMIMAMQHHVTRKPAIETDGPFCVYPGPSLSGPRRISS